MKCQVYRCYDKDNVEGERDGAALCDRSRSTDGLCGNVATERRPTGADFDEEAK